MATTTMRSLFTLPPRRMFSTTVAARQSFSIGRSYDGMSSLGVRPSGTDGPRTFDQNSTVANTNANAGADEYEGFTPQEMQSNAHRFRQGEMYSPHDLTLEEMKKRRIEKRKNFRDVFDVLGVNPIDEYKNFNLLGDYITSMGRIMHSSETGLRPVNQRRIAKAIRRAIGLGLHPSVHKHPELLIAQEQGRQAQTTRKSKGWKQAQRRRP